MLEKYNIMLLLVIFKNMTLKKYRTIKLIVVFAIAFIFSQSIINKNFVVPLVTLAVSSLLLIQLRKKVTDIVADERDYTNGGKAALLAMQIYSWVAVMAMFILYSFRDLNPMYEPVGMTLAYSTCLLMIIYSVVFSIYNKSGFKENKWRIIVAISILALFLIFFSIRLFSGEDNWMCQNGEWIKHGNPSFPAPTIECK